MSTPNTSHIAARPRTVALVGNPNTGKTTLFNELTGFRQRVGNYPGVTVERKTGPLRDVGDGPPVEILDLPGAYSLAAGSADEAIVLDALVGMLDTTEKPDAIVCVVDGGNLQRNLFFASQVMELGRPVVVALNMIDLAEAKGIRIDARTLSDELGVPVVSVVASKRSGLNDLRQAILKALDDAPSGKSPAFPTQVDAELEGLSQRLAERPSSNGSPTRSRAELLQVLLEPGGYHEARLKDDYGPDLVDELTERRERITTGDESLAELEARIRYDWIDTIAAKSIRRVHRAPLSKSDRADRFLTHPLGGMAAFLAVMAVVFQSIYSWAGPLMDLIDGVFSGLALWVVAALPPGALQSLFANGVIAGVGSVLIFLPQIMILFLFVAILEDCGYMARAALVMHRFMRVLGLSGKSFIPLISSFACAVPGIMAARTIEHPKDRLITILVAPLMSCSARLPVYILMIGAFVPSVPLLGGLVNAQGLTLLAMYSLGVAVAIPVAFILRRTVDRRPCPSFLMELPGYKWPTVRTVVYRVYEQGREFVAQAGTIIFAVSVVIWALGYYPRPASIAVEHQASRAVADQAYTIALDDIAVILDPAMGGAEVADHEQVAPLVVAIQRAEDGFTVAVEEEGLDPESLEWQAARAQADVRIDRLVADAGSAGAAARDYLAAVRVHDEALAEIDHSEAGDYLRQSLLGRMGTFIEPVVKPLGWDWRIGTAAIASFPAREVIVATMGTIYNLGGDQDESSSGLRATLARATWPDGKRVFNLAVALSVMVFFALCCQCAATLAAIRRETNSWRWPLLTFLYMTAFAYVGALVTYQVTIRLI